MTDIPYRHHLRIPVLLTPPYPTIVQSEGCAPDYVSGPRKSHSVVGNLMIQERLACQSQAIWVSAPNPFLLFGTADAFHTQEYIAKQVAHMQRLTGVNRVALA